MKIQFSADHIQVSGPKATDGSYRVVFETGEYEQQNVVQLLAVPQRVAVKVTVEVIEK